jgi:adenosylcobinamide kinase/adenosylcobinamide-phosphate guanylyltransferase
VITLFVGGARSGKSEVAERFVATLPPPTTYVATWVPAAGDEADADMQARIAAHRARRPAQWALHEVSGDLATPLRSISGTVLVDALGTWVGSTPDFAVDSGSLCSALVERSGDTVVVTDEVGLAVHPSTSAGRRFRDVLGRVNGEVAAVADQVWLVVAGHVVPLVRPAW